MSVIVITKGNESDGDKQEEYKYNQSSLYPKLECCATL